MLGAIRTLGIQDRWLGSREYTASSQKEKELGGGEKGRNGCQSHCQPNRIWKTTRLGWETGADTCKAQGDSKTLAMPAGTVAPLPCENVLVEKTRLTEAYLVWSDNQIPNQ